MQRARGGDDDAFRGLVARHDGALLALATRLLGERDAAEDLRQQAWWRIWKALHQFDGRARFATWAWTIVVNLCRDRRRARGRAVPLEATSATATLATLVDGAAPPPEALLQNERAAQVRAALASLPDDERECLVLRHYHDLAPAAIAEVVGRPRTTVQSCLARALLRLQLRLRPQLAQDEAQRRTPHCGEADGAMR